MVSHNERSKLCCWFWTYLLACSLLHDSWRGTLVPRLSLVAAGSQLDVPYCRVSRVVRIYAVGGRVSGCSLCGTDDLTQVKSSQNTDVIGTAERFVPVDRWNGKVCMLALERFVGEWLGG